MKHISSAALLPVSHPTTAPSAAAPRHRWGRRLLWLIVLWVALYHGLPRLLDIPEPLKEPPGESGGITDRHGRPLRQPLADGRRTAPFAFHQAPRALIDATVSAEDKRFWQHGGIDVIGLVRAAVDSIAAGRPVSGASTITQQLVKVATGRYAHRTWRDKLREMAYARKLEITWTKERILSEYLQRVEYGNSTTGAAAAAQLYFRKPLSDLSLAESAFLAGLPQAPTRLNPYRNFVGAKNRQEWILSRMVEDGRLTEEEAARAANEPLRLRRWTGGFEAPHFVDMLLAAGKRASPPSPALAETPAEASPRPKDDALAATLPPELTAARQTGVPQVLELAEEPSPRTEVRTTLDLELQHFVEQTVRTQLARLASRQVREAAVVVLDNATGGVRALVGSPDYFAQPSGQVNGALAPRSAGSTLKPFTYLLALHQGATPATIVDDLPVEFMTPTGLYRPMNYDRHYYGPISYREALGNSLNIAAVRVLQRIGGPEVLHAALQTLGFTTLAQPPEHYGLGLTIGNAEVKLLELANAYACLARLGEWRPLVLHAEAEAANAQKKSQLFDRDACWLLADMLSDPQARARCFGLASPLRLPFRAAVKTGTSTDFRDNWCAGYTPEFTVAVWVGNFDRRPMNRVSGVSGAAPIWREIMLWLERRHGVSWYEQPASIVEAEVDPLTGEQVPDQWRSRRPVVREKFTAETRPLPPPPERYDALGRVILPRDYARWLRSPDNWVGTAAVAATTSTHDRTSPLLIQSPLSGATLLLDPDLPEGGRRLPLRANVPTDRVEWWSDSLPIERQGNYAYALLSPGRHHIRVRDRETGETAIAAITVKSL